MPCRINTQGYNLSRESESHSSASPLDLHPSRRPSLTSRSSWEDISRSQSALTPSSSAWEDSSYNAHSSFGAQRSFDSTISLDSSTFSPATPSATDGVSPNGFSVPDHQQFPPTIAPNMLFDGLWNASDFHISSPDDSTLIGYTEKYFDLQGRNDHQFLAVQDLNSTPLHMFPDQDILLADFNPTAPHFEPIYQSLSFSSSPSLDPPFTTPAKKRSRAYPLATLKEELTPQFYKDSLSEFDPEDLKSLPAEKSGYVTPPSLSPSPHKASSSRSLRSLIHTSHLEERTPARSKRRSHKLELPVVVNRAKQCQHRCTAKNCTSAFKRQEHLKRHVRGVHEQHKMECIVDQCKTKYISRGDNLKQHYRTHMKPKKAGRNKQITLREVEELERLTGLDFSKEKEEHYGVPRLTFESTLQAET